jgi:outer membrane protein assembly factor BamB
MFEETTGNRTYRIDPLLPFGDTTAPPELKGTLMTSRHLLPTGLILVFAATIAVSADDWPQWRGPNRDNKCQETGLLQEWPEGGPPLAWKANGFGIGFSTVSVSDGIIYTMGDFKDDGCYAIAVKEADGSPVWKTKVGKTSNYGGYPGPRSTPTVDGGQVFVLSPDGDVACLDAKSGEKVWTVNYEQDFNGRPMSPWHYSESLLVDGNRVVGTPGGKDGGMIALDRNSGQQIWRTTDWPDVGGYSSIIIATIEGTRQYVQLAANSVVGVDPESGKVLWKADRKGKTAVIPTPVVSDNIVFVTSGYGIGCNGFRITKDGSIWNTEELYANKNITNHHGGVVLLNGHVFGSTGGSFRCVDIRTGELTFQGRSVGKGSTLYADGHFILRSEGGPVALIEATPKELVEVSRFGQPDRSNRQAWPHPVIANGKLYLRDQGLLLCYDVKKK